VAWRVEKMSRARSWWDLSEESRRVRPAAWRRVVGSGGFDLCRQYEAAFARAAFMSFLRFWSV